MVVTLVPAKTLGFLGGFGGTRGVHALLAISFVLLLIVFGGFWAALMPLAVGVFAIITTNPALRVIAEFTDVSVFALNLTTALGLGLAIDYSLLILRRYHEEIATGAAHEVALAHAMATAGRTVAFSGITVAVALATLLVFPLYFLRSFAYAGVAVVIASLVGPLVITPAAITLLRSRLTAPSKGSAAAQGIWSRTAGWVQDHARVVAPLAILAMVALALTFGSVQFGTSDYRQLQPDVSVRQAQERIQADFPLTVPPFAVIAAGPTSKARQPQKTSAVLSAISALPGVTGVREVRSAQQSILVVEAAVDPMSTKARTLLASVREVDPAAQVGGSTAQLVDTENAIGSRFPLAIGVVLAAALILVFLLSESLLFRWSASSPTVSASPRCSVRSCGFFQGRYFSGWLGFTSTGYIDVSQPALMACVAMALSLDYGVFVVARLVEEHRHEPVMRTVLANALQRTGGVVGATALILSNVLVAIGTSSITNTKMLGLGVALAVLVDATAMRAVVVPACLALLGDAVSKATLTGVVKTLVARGWMAKLSRTDDRRLVELRLTAAGRELMEDLSPKFNAIGAAVVKGVPSPQKREMTDTLRSIVTALEDPAPTAG